MAYPIGYTKEGVIREAVDHHLSGNGSFMNFWTYYTNQEMRDCFADSVEFRAECVGYEQMLVG